MKGIGRNMVIYLMILLVVGSGAAYSIYSGYNSKMECIEQCAPYRADYTEAKCFCDMSKIPPELKKEVTNT